MTRQEAKEYYQKLAQDAGLSTEEAQTVMKAFDNEKFSQGFVPRPDYSRSLDQTRNELQGKINWYEKEWYPKAKEAYDKNLQGMALLDRYRQTYGDFDEGNGNGQPSQGQVRHAAQATGLTEQQVRELIAKDREEALAGRDRATLDLMEIREEHMDTFKKRLNMREFEGFVAEQRKQGSTDNLRSLYREYVGGDIQKMQETQLAERIKREREDAIKDYQTRHGIPAEPKAKVPHPFFDRNEIAAKEGKDGKVDEAAGREAFVEVMSDPDGDSLTRGELRQRFPV